MALERRAGPIGKNKEQDKTLLHLANSLGFKNRPEELRAYLRSGNKEMQELERGFQPGTE